MPTFSGRPSTAANANLPAMTEPVPASASDIQRLLGDVDPMIVARVFATNASPDEINEALREVEDEVGFGEASHEPSSPRVTEVRAILDEMHVFEPDGDDDEDFGPIDY